MEGRNRQMDRWTGRHIKLRGFGRKFRKPHSGDFFQAEKLYDPRTRSCHFSPLTLPCTSSGRTSFKMLVRLSTRLWTGRGPNLKEKIQEEVQRPGVGIERPSEGLLHSCRRQYSMTKMGPCPPTPSCRRTPGGQAKGSAPYTALHMVGMDRINT